MLFLAFLVLFSTRACFYLLIDGGLAIGEAAATALAVECPESIVRALVDNHIVAHIISRKWCFSARSSGLDLQGTMPAICFGPINRM